MGVADYDGLLWKVHIGMERSIAICKEMPVPYMRLENLGPDKGKKFIDWGGGVAG